MVIGLLEILFLCISDAVVLVCNHRTVVTGLTLMHYGTSRTLLWRHSRDCQQTGGTLLMLVLWWYSPVFWSLHHRPFDRRRQWSGKHPKQNVWGEFQARFGILFGRDKLIVRLSHGISVLAGHEAAASKLYGGHVAKVGIHLGVWNHFKTFIITAIQKRNWLWHGDIEVDRSFYCISVTCHYLRNKVPSWRTGEAFSTVPPPLPAPAEGQRRGRGGAAI